jgi:PAT family beta-lactamase induction signal transducer AmpG
VTVQETPNTGPLDVFRSKRMAVLFLLGFSGGLPMLLTSQTLQAWMSAVKLDLGTIADLQAIGLAYTLKFLWAPLFDRYRLPWLGRRRGWCLLLQLLLIGAIVVLGAIDPRAHPLELAGLAIVVAFLSASQDVIIDAYKADILAPHERGAGSAMYVLGYRVAMLVSGALAIVMGDYMPWSTVYAIMAGLMLIGIAGTLLAEEPAASATAPRTLASALVLPLREFWQRLGARDLALVLGFAALYRFGDYFARGMIVAFLHTETKFSLTEIGVVYKGVGFAGLALGGLFGGSLIARFGLRRMLVTFGVLAAVTNLLYGWLAVAGHNLPIFCAAVAVDEVGTALGTTAFLALLMGVTSPAVSATQFALLTSLSSIGQRVFGPFGNDVVAAVDWTGFFLTTAAMALPGLVLAWRVAHLKRDV